MYLCCSYSFPKQNHSARIKRRFFLISGKPCEVLQVRIFCDLFHKFTVGILKFRLDIFYPSDSSQPKSDKIFTAVSLALALDTS